MLQTEMAPGCHWLCRRDRLHADQSRVGAAEREDLVSGSRWGRPGALSWRKARSQLRPKGGAFR